MGTQNGEGFAPDHHQLYHDPNADPVPKSLDLRRLPGSELFLFQTAISGKKRHDFAPGLPRQAVSGTK